MLTHKLGHKKNRIGCVETVRQYASTAEYYRGLLEEIGDMFGKEALIADDGTVSDSVLCAKIPSLVRNLKAISDKAGGF